MKLAVYEGKSKVKDLDLTSLIGDKSDEALYQVVVGRLSHDRQGNAFTKTKSEVRGGGKKPWKQKGLARARAGSIRSPLWRGGGVTFGPKPRDFSKLVNKKMKTKALVTVFSHMAELEKIKVFSDFSFDSHKTKDFLKAVEGLANLSENTVMIIPSYNKSMLLASRNLPKFYLLSLDSLDMLPLIYADHILISEKAVLDLDAKIAALIK